VKTFSRPVAFLLAPLLALITVWACQATRNRDGSITLTFAPDMVITAWGLEDALSKLTDLLKACNNGTFPRPCTDAERDDILQAMQNTLDAKQSLSDPPAPGSGGSVPTC
jgi:hypothetical protein